MIIADFTRGHIEEALDLAKSNYDEERSCVSILPHVDILPSLTDFADNGLGAVAFESGKMVGFLCCCKPWDGITSNARGIFSPVHAHGAICENREMIYKRLYQASAEKWAKQGVSWHAIALYAHDKPAVNAFFTYGFGLRCIDAIRLLEEIECKLHDGCSFRELASDDIKRLLPLKNMLIEHLGKSPMFLYFPPETKMELEAIHDRRKSRYFCAFQGDALIAFVEVTDSGENFACDDKSMKNICGAFCLPEHRGKGIYQSLLNFTISVLKAEGYTRLGVDFESFNPTAYGFWLKYFTAYTHSVVRRIDEKILEVIA